MGTATQTGTDVSPFLVEIPEEELAELRRRIAAWEEPHVFASEVRAALRSLR